MDIAVDPRLELLMTVQSASPYLTTGPLRRESFPYLAAAHALARSHQDHPAVTLWRDLHADGFTHDRPVIFTLWHSPLPNFSPSTEYHQADYASELLTRAKGTDRLRRFADALRDFAAAADFAAFLDQWRPTLAAYEAQARRVIDPTWPARLDDYAGRPPRDLRICLVPLSLGSYGPTIRGTSYAVLAPLWGGTGPVFDIPAHMEYLVLHEGAHGFVNPAMDTVAAELEASASLLPPIADRMAAQDYPRRWLTAVYEHVVRAVVARLSPDPEAVLAREHAQGFLYIRPVADALAEYEIARHRYPDFTAFAPRIADVFSRLAAETARRTPRHPAPSDGS